MMKIHTLLLSLLVTSAIYTTTCNANPLGVTGTAEQILDATAAVPLIKMRQGEKFKLFDGAGGGVKWSPWIADTSSSLKELHFSGLLMVSSTSDYDANNPSNKEQNNIFSVGFVIGYSWLQFGVGRDIISSESKTVFDAKEKTFYMLNLGGSIKF